MDGSREEPVLMVGTLRHARARRCQTGDFRPRQLQSGKPDRYHRIHACQQTRSEVGRQAGLKTDAQAVSFFYKGGTSAPVTVSTDGTFRVEKSSGADWLVVATNNNLLMFTAEPYSGTDKRTATVSLYLTTTARMSGWT